jgi:hypothetical protein
MVKKEVVSQRNSLVKASHQCTILTTMMGFAIAVMEVRYCSLKAMLVVVDITKP